MEKANLSALTHGPRFLRPSNIAALVAAAEARVEARIVAALATLKHILNVALDRLLRAATKVVRTIVISVSDWAADGGSGYAQELALRWRNLQPAFALSAWSTTTSAMERYFARNVKPYVDTPRHKVEGIAVRNEQRAMAEAARV